MAVMIAKVSRMVVEEADVDMKMCQLSIYLGDIDSPTTIVAILRSLDVDGRWDTAVTPVRREFQDSDQSKAAINFREAMMSAVIPDTPEARVLGVVGLSVQDAGIHMLRLAGVTT